MFDGNVQVLRDESEVVVFGLRFPLALLDSDVFEIGYQEDEILGAGYLLKYSPPETDELLSAEIQVTITRQVTKTRPDSIFHSEGWAYYSDLIDSVFEAYRASNCEYESCVLVSKHFRALEETGLAYALGATFEYTHKLGSVRQINHILMAKDALFIKVEIETDKEWDNEEFIGIFAHSIANYINAPFVENPLLTPLH